MTTIKGLAPSKPIRSKTRQRNLRTYQALEPPQDKEFELSELLKLRGVERPSNCQYSYARQWLRDNNFVPKRIHGRREFWIYRTLSTNNDPLKTTTFTRETFIQRYFPGISLPVPESSWWRWAKIMREWGLRPRMGETYWSYKLERRKPLRTSYRHVSTPKTVKIPKGAFCLLDLLELNKLNRFPENFAWAKQYLKQRGIERIHGTHRYAARDKRGRLPAAVTGLWQIPQQVFTTYEFQLLNNCRRPTSEEWKLALDFLRVSGYIFDPQWKRWCKQT